MPNPPPEETRGYFDENGILLIWPSRGRATKRTIVLSWLCSHFKPGRGYRESEVNELLKSLHAFNDHVLLRRELVDFGYLRRDRYGSEYQVCQPSPLAPVG